MKRGIRYIACNKMKLFGFILNKELLYVDIWNIEVGESEKIVVRSVNHDILR